MRTQGISSVPVLEENASSIFPIRMIFFAFSDSDEKPSVNIILVHLHMTEILDSYQRYDLQIFSLILQFIFSLSLSNL